MHAPIGGETCPFIVGKKVVRKWCMKIGDLSTLFAAGVLLLLLPWGLTATSSTLRSSSSSRRGAQPAGKAQTYRYVLRLFDTRILPGLGALGLVPW